MCERACVRARVCVCVYSVVRGERLGGRGGGKREKEGKGGVRGGVREGFI